VESATSFLRGNSPGSETHLAGILHSDLDVSDIQKELPVQCFAEIKSLHLGEVKELKTRKNSELSCMTARKAKVEKQPEAVKS